MRVTQQRTELELERLFNQERATRRKLDEEVRAGQFGFAAQSGSQASALEQLNFQLEQEAKKDPRVEHSRLRAFVAHEAASGDLHILRKNRERNLQLQLGEFNAQRGELDLQQQARGLEAARDRRAVDRGP